MRKPPLNNLGFSSHSAFPNRQSIYDVIVIGAGAAGMMAAGRAAELGARVLVVEKMPRAGLKLGITGKGRCNLANLGDIQTFMESYSPDGRFLRNCFARFFNQDLMGFFKDKGVPWAWKGDKGYSPNRIGPWMWGSP